MSNLSMSAVWFVISIMFVVKFAAARDVSWMTLSMNCLIMSDLVKIGGDKNGT